MDDEKLLRNRLQSPVNNKSVDFVNQVVSPKLKSFRYKPLVLGLH